MSEVRQQRAAAVGVDQIVSAWETMNDGNPYFAVFYNRSNKYFQFNKNDLDAAKQFLITNLQTLSEAGDNAMYYLNIYDEPSRNYTNGGMVSSLPFRLNEYQPSMGGFSLGGSEQNSLIKILTDSHAKEMELQKEILKLKYENQPATFMDMIGGVIEAPGAAQALVPLLQPVIAAVMGLVGKISGLPVGAPAPMGIAGALLSAEDKETALDAALSRLEKHGDLVELLTVLANFADKNPEMFKMYFNGLKSQQ